MPVKPYVVYYRIIEFTALVEILSVRHGARDRPARFFQ
jgi:plasmid stabilization system protein ParE